MLKFLIILVLLSLAAALPGVDYYDDKYDDFDVDEVIDNIRLLRSYAQCFIGVGKCTPDGNNFKKWIPDGIQTDCGRCTAKQKVMVAKVIKAMQAKIPAEWNKLLKIHDPETKRTSELDAYLKKYAP